MYRGNGIFLGVENDGLTNSGKLTELWKITKKIVDFPMKHGDFP